MANIISKEYAADIWHEVVGYVYQTHRRQSMEIYDNSIELTNEGIEAIPGATEENRKQGDKLTRIILAESKIRYVAEIFVRSGYSMSDAEIANIINEAQSVNPFIPTISRSSIDRYLKDSRLNDFYSLDIYHEIMEARKNNLLAAKSKGGKAYAENNVPTYDEDGRFTGSVKK
ncbi:MAG: hypothetical protein IJO63_00520 [Bacilli bacterium]|nr:hypothetical protein [Bacilli bacterium]